MDWFQQYDLCCRISLFRTEEVLFETYDSHFLDYEDEVSFTHKPSFLYNKKTEQIEELDSYVLKEDCVYIDNVVHQIQTLQTEDVDTFTAISKYFEVCLNDICKTYNKSLDKIYLLLVIPDNWGNSTTMVALLEKAGVVFPQDLSEKIVCITQVDAAVSNFQTNAYFKQQIPSFFQKEGPCTVFDIRIDSNAIQLHSTNCNIQEDQSLKLLDEPFYTAEVERVSVSRSFIKQDVESLRGALAQAVFTKLFDLESLITNTTDVPEDAPDCKSVAEYILDDMLMNIRDVVRQEYKFDSNMRILYDNAVIEKHLDDTQRKYLYTKEFFDVLIKEVTTLISIESAVEYIQSQTSGEPVFINGCHDYETLDFRSTLHSVFFYLVQKQVSVSNWHFVKDGLRSLHIKQGAFSKMTRRSMVDNMSLKPIVVEERKELNQLGLPSYVATEESVRPSDAPETIVHIDVSVNSTIVFYEMMDTEGRVQQRYEINIEETLFNDLSNELEKLKVADKETTTKAKDSFITDLKRVLTFAKEELKDDVNLEKVGYVLSVDKSITKSIQLGSREELLELIKNNELPERLVVVNQGERTVWKKLKEDLLKASSYYVHAHISDESIYLNLKQVVDVNGELSTISLKNKLVDIKNVYEQVSEKFWLHLHSLDRKHNDITYGGKIDYAKDYERFQRNFINTFKQKFSYRDIDETGITFEVAENCNISIPIHDIMDIAVVPVARELAATIFSGLVEFEHYVLAGLFITGGVLKVKGENGAYNYGITFAMENELIKGRQFGGKLNVVLDTDFENLLDLKIRDQEKAFGYDAFSKGELCPVSSTTYLLSEDINDDDDDWTLEGAFKHDRSSAVTIRGTKFSNKKFKMVSKKREGGEDSFLIGIHRFIEPHTANNSLNVLEQEHRHVCNLEFASVKTVSIEPLYYKSCVKITIDNYYLDKQEHDVFEYVFGERQTLRYFK